MPTYQLEISGRRFEVEAPTREDALRVANEFAVQPRPGGGPVTGAPTPPGFAPTQGPTEPTAPEPRTAPPYSSLWQNAIQGGAAFGREMGIGTMESIAAMMPAGDTPQNVQPPFSPLPESTAGQFGRTIGSFLPGAVTLGPGAFTAGNAMRYGVVPGLVTEAMGQVGDEFGPNAGAYARVAGAILGTGGAAVSGHAGVSAGLPRSQAGGAQLIGQALRDARVTPDEIAMAESLIQEGVGAGIPVTWPEALHLVSNGRVDLTAMQRTIEQASTGRAIMSDVMGSRPPAIRRAVEGQAQQLGPLTPPNVVGPQVQRTAAERISDLRKQINQMTEGLYETAGPTPIDPTGFEFLMADPLFVEGLNAVRNSPTYGRLVSNYPDNSVAVMDAVKKWLDDVPNIQRGQPTAEAIRESVAGQVRREASNASPEYADALSTQAFARQNWLAPLESGPLGAMAGTDDLARQLRAVFPTNPLAGTQNEVRIALGMISESSPEAAQAIVRHHIEGVFNEAAQALQGGPNQAGGASFVAQLQGNAQQRQNLQAAFEAAFPDGAERWEGFQQLMRVLEATGRRPGANSATAANLATQEQMSRAGTPAGRFFALGASPGKWLSAVENAYGNLLIRRNGAAMADIITNPANGDVFRRLAAGGPINDLMAIAGELVFGQAPQISGGLNQRTSIADTVAAFAP